MISSVCKLCPEIKDLLGRRLLLLEEVEGEEEREANERRGMSVGSES